eukprot:jgi/Psemu1/312933/fgenesh1_kg.1059_\
MAHQGGASDRKFLENAWRSLDGGGKETVFNCLQFPFFEGCFCYGKIAGGESGIRIV